MTNANDDCPKRKGTRTFLCLKWDELNIVNKNKVQ